MKYVVELKYTNPAHDHVTLRRRVDTVNRIVEAKNEAEALNRAANQQRALGFKIQEAKIVEQPKAPVKTEQLTEATVKDLRTSLKAMDLRHGVDSDKRDAGYKKSPAVAAAQKKFDTQSKGQGKMRPQAGTLAAVHKSMEREMQKESVEYIEEKLTAADPASKWISDFVASDNPKFAGKSKKERINMALGAYYSAKRGGDMKEGYDPSSEDIAKMLVKKHGVGNVTKQHILDLESDRDSFKGLDHDEIMKHVAKMDEAVSFGRSGGVMHYNPKTEKSETPKTGVNALDKEGNLVGHYKDLETAKKFKPGHTYKTNKGVVEEVEAIEEANTRVVNKEVKKEKAAETAVAAARRAKNTKNKVEVEPKLDMNVAGSEKKYVTKV